MNRTDRLLAIILELEAKGKRCAEDIATKFEITKRTVYRDIQALCEAGVPIVAVPGQGYSIMEGYFLPPLSFTHDEAMMLILGSESVAQRFDAQYRDAAHSAARKIQAILPARLRTQVNSLKGSIHFISLGFGDDEASVENLKRIRRAIIEKKSISLRYFRKNGGERQPEPTTREADPYALVHLNGNWLMSGYCHLRRDIRTFRLSRMENVVVTSKEFTRHRGFSIRQLAQGKSPGTTARVLCDTSVARWVMESRPYGTIKSESTDKGLMLTVRIDNEAQILPWVLSWGSKVKVLEPDSLKRCVKREAEALLRNADLWQ